MTSLADLKKEFLKDPENAAEYEALAPFFDVARQLIAARTKAGLTQAQVAELMGTKQSAVARIENARQNVSVAKLMSYAAAVGAKIDIQVHAA